MERQSRRGWIVVGTTFVTLAVIYGAWYSYSVFLVALVREFGWSRSLVAGAFSFFSLVHGALGPLIGWLLRRAGARRLILLGSGVMGIGLILTAQTAAWWHLYLAFGCITALGISLTGWVPLVVLVQAWFPDRVGTAMGIASAGIGVGILGLVPVSQLLVEWWGWRWAFRILAALTVTWGVPAALWLVQEPPAFRVMSSGPPGIPTGAGAGTHWTLSAAVRTWRFWGLAGVFFRELRGGPLDRPCRRGGRSGPPLGGGAAPSESGPRDSLTAQTPRTGSIRFRPKLLRQGGQPSHVCLA